MEEGTWRGIRGSAKQLLSSAQLDTLLRDSALNDPRTEAESIEEGAVPQAKLLGERTKKLGTSPGT